MYRLLLVLDRGSEAEMLYSSVFTKEAGFYPLVFAPDEAEAVKLIRKESFDAVGVMPGSETEGRLSEALAEMDSPLPMFTLQEDHEGMLRDLKHLLNRLIGRNPARDSYLRILRHKTLEPSLNDQTHNENNQHQYIEHVYLPPLYLG